MYRRLNKYLPNAASVAVGIIPIVVLILWFGVPRKIIGLGAIAYAVGAVAIKLPVYQLLVVKVLHKKLSDRWLAVSQGFLSAVAELGAALLFFLFLVPELTFAKLIGFGVAAGSIEAIILPFMKNPLEGTPLEDHAGESMLKAESNLSIQWLGVGERVLACFTHTATRGLVYVSVITGSFVPAFIAIITFAALDGRAYYAHLQKWDFADAHVLIRFYHYFILIAAVQTMSFLFFYFVR